MWTRLVILFWLALRREAVVVALGGTRLYGVNYSLRVGPDWAWGADRCKSYDRIVAELSQLKSSITDNVRVFSLTDCDTGALLLQATQSVGMGLWLGIWVGPDQSNFVEERNRLQQLLLDYDFSNVLGIHVSSEAIYREDITVSEAMALRNIIKQDMVEAGLDHIPITVADIADTYVKFPDLILVDSMALTANLFPFWEPTLVNINGDSPANAQYPSAAEFFDQKFWPVEQKAESRQIIITETGWPDAGVNEYANVAAPASMAKWLRDFVCLANAKGWQYFWFDSYDSSWRRVNEQRPYDVEGHFGLFDEEGNLKSHIRDLVIDCSAPYWDVDPNGIVNPTMSPSGAAIYTPPSPPPTIAPIETPMPTETPVTVSPTQFPTPNPVNTVPTNPFTPLPSTSPVTDSPSSETETLTTNPPTTFPSVAPITDSPTGLTTTYMPTLAPSSVASSGPTLRPTRISVTPPPSTPPSAAETEPPSTIRPTALPTSPSVDPIMEDVVDAVLGMATASEQPTGQPSLTPTEFPSEKPSVDPTTSVGGDNLASSLVDVPFSQAHPIGYIPQLSAVVFAWAMFNI